jgi:hypothetical protein
MRLLSLIGMFYSLTRHLNYTTFVTLRALNMQINKNMFIQIVLFSRDFFLHKE